MILLQKLVDAKALPAEPLITAVTLAELSVGPLATKAKPGAGEAEPPRRCTCSERDAISRAPRRLADASTQLM